jgi:hypothetical protein
MKQPCSAWTLWWDRLCCLSMSFIIVLQTVSCENDGANGTFGFAGRWRLFSTYTTLFDLLYLVTRLSAGRIKFEVLLICRGLDGSYRT